MGPLARLLLGHNATSGECTSTSRPRSTNPVEDPKSVSRWVRPRREVLIYIISVSRRLGHADVQTTLNTYAHVTEDVEMRAVAQWKAFTAGWRVGAHAHEQIGSGS